jgi:phosphopantothenoylcysteine decarboxylase/phosphopantothenate--cysteine ligase
MLRGRTIVVGVSGGIAAYKACELVRRLKEGGASVIVVMTAAATEFVTPLTFETLSGNPVVRDLWGRQHEAFEVPKTATMRLRGRVAHVDVAEVADAMVIAPATADLMARLVHGEAPDALTTTVLATRAPLVVCPAMDLEMWKNAATQENVRTLRSRGVRLVGPDSGALASGLEGPGRLAAIDAIVEAVDLALDRRKSLEGVHVLVTAGRTEEPLDPVRVLTNRSSGRMGFALAEAARDRGAHVTLVAGETSVEPPGGVTLQRIHTAVEMERAVMAAAAHADLVLMAAAVADYRPIRPREEKIKRTGATMTVELAPNPDVLARAAAKRHKGQLFVGFALETTHGLKNAREKLARKRIDLVVLNAPADSLGLDTNRVTLVDRTGARELEVMTKREAAEHILDRSIELRTGAGRGGTRAGANGDPRKSSRRRVTPRVAARGARGPAARPRRSGK